MEIDKIIIDGLLAIIKSEFEYINGGKGSGNFKHKGRKGLVGGSSNNPNSKPLEDYLGSYYKKYITHSLSELLGTEFIDIKGQEAVDKIFKEKMGHVKNAFYRPSIGNISICWGDDTCGLRHIILRRYKKKQNIMKVIRNIGQVIKNGKIKELEDRYELNYKDFRVIISKEIKNEKHICLITGIEIKKD